MPITDEQKKIIHAEDQHVLVVAGAGTGKTFTMIERVKELINNKKVEPERILLTSFSRTANSELHDKICKVLNEKIANKITIKTIHALCYTIISENKVLLNLKNIEIVDESYPAKIMYNKHTHKFTTQGKAFALFSVYRKKLLNNETLEHTLDQEMCDEAQKIMEEKGKLLFDDLLLKSFRLLVSNRDIFEKWNNKFDHVIIDESQDTSQIQWNIAKIFIGDKTNTVAVGDVKQNIYGFRGAHYMYMDEFRRSYNSTVYQLSETFRFGQHFADLSNKIIEQMKIDPIYKQHTITNVKHNNKPNFLKINSDEQPNNIVQSIKRYKADGYDFRDMNILFRYNKEVLPFIDLFLSHQIPFQLKSGDVWKRQEIKFIFKVWSVLFHFNIGDTIDLFNFYSDSVGDKIITTAYNQVDIKTNVFTFIDEALTLKMDNVGKTRLQSFKNMRDRLKNTLDYIEKCKPVKPSFEKIADLMNIETTKFMIKGKTEEGDDIITDRKAFLSWFEKAYISSDYYDIMEWYNVASLNSFANKDKDKDAVQLKTIHGSKGQSLPIVFLIANRICDPHFIKEQEDKEAELFCLYVAITRAEKHLNIYIANPSMFNFNFIFPEEWQRYIGAKQVDESGNEVVVPVIKEKKEITDSLLESLRKCYLANKRSFSCRFHPEVKTVTSTDKAVQLDYKGKKFWIPTKFLGYYENRYYAYDWIVGKNSLYGYCDVS